MHRYYCAMPTTSPELDRLAARLRDRPESRCFAALADGLRKLGAVDDAAAIAERGVRFHPGFIPGRLTLARILIERNDAAAARAEVEAALERDPAHPVALEMLARLVPAAAATAASGQPHAVLASRPAVAEAPLDLDDEPDEPVVTESMAQVYRRQGHLEDALQVYEALVERNPGDRALRERRDSLLREVAAARPRPYDAGASGGPAVGEWLAALAAQRAPGEQVPTSSYDAFFLPADQPVSDNRDLSAFQAWLRELER